MGWKQVRSPGDEVGVGAGRQHLVAKGRTLDLMLSVGGSH